MREVLSRWVRDADALRQVEHFRLAETPPGLEYVSSRVDDLYLSLTGELFDRIRGDYENPDEWARLGNAFAQFASGPVESDQPDAGVSRAEAALFAAAAFYFGGFPASAYLVLRESAPAGPDEAFLACHDLLARPSAMSSAVGRSLLTAVRIGDSEAVSSTVAAVAARAASMLDVGPEAWIPARLLERLVRRFAAANVRAVLPGGYSPFWSPLVTSLLDRRPPSWDFFPSQIEAIGRGLLTSDETFTLQMPTGAGKTALSETLLYFHLMARPSTAAVLLVPFRSLASELRTTLVPRLNAMGLPSRCAYGGTVPSADEIQDLDQTRALVATPEALSGLLTADASFYQRVSLVICDEGHLLDSAGRGVALELLLARFKARESGAPRFVFVSAIVPNVEEINAWLGGSYGTVVRSSYRPAFADFAVLRRNGSGAETVVQLQLHPHEPAIRVGVDNFLARRDFRYLNPTTGHWRTYPFTSNKAQAVATARKALPMGAAVVFAANKRGSRGAVGLTEELMNQLEVPIPLPVPSAFADGAVVAAAAQYFELEYGAAWIGTRALRAGAVLHHGDVPQESREVVEGLLRQGKVRLAICTNTLAEGVNLPIRTLVLYSVRRMHANGALENLLTRDIKNLVGRAGRAGASTKGLVVCANPQQWPLIEPVALQAAGENVIGALLTLIRRIRSALQGQQITLTNEQLEGVPDLYALIDGVDATLVDLAAEEIGEARLLEIAEQLVSETFAARRADTEDRRLMSRLFELRARRVAEFQARGRIPWIRETGARARLVESVENSLAPRLPRWDGIVDPRDPALVRALIGWAWTYADVQAAIRQAYRAQAGSPEPGVSFEAFEATIAQWLAGYTFEGLAIQAGLSVDDLLGVHSRVWTYALQTVIDQGVAVLAKVIESTGGSLAQAVRQFPELLRFGVPTVHACTLMRGGVRHRRAAVALGIRPELAALSAEAKDQLFVEAQRVLDTDGAGWRVYLGDLVMDNTLADLRKGPSETA